MHACTCMSVCMADFLRGKFRTEKADGRGRGEEQSPDKNVQQPTIHPSTKEPEMEAVMYV